MKKTYIIQYEEGMHDEYEHAKKPLGVNIDTRTTLVYTQLNLNSAGKKNESQKIEFNIPRLISNSPASAESN